MYNLSEIGMRCKRYRTYCGYRQEDVAKETGYTKENISSFENGRNDNCRILLWYLGHGMTYYEVMGW